MNNPREFYAEEGKPIIPVLNRFSRFVKRESKLTVTGGARVMKTAAGRRVIYEPTPQTFPGSFRVSLPRSRWIAVSEGLVSGLVPYMDGRRIDGLTEKKTPHEEGKPNLLLTPPELGGDRSYVILFARVTADGEIGEDGTTTDPIAEIVHRYELPAGMREEGKVARLIAVIYWQGEQVTSVRQVVWYDQEVFPSGDKARMRAAS